MDDDFNSPGGLAVAFELAKTLNKEQNQRVHAGAGVLAADVLQAKAKALLDIADVLGLAIPEAEEDQTDAPSGGLSDDDLRQMLEQRQAARKAKDFATADGIRDRLAAEGIAIVDRADGSSHWVRQ